MVLITHLIAPPQQGQYVTLIKHIPILCDKQVTPVWQNAERYNEWILSSNFYICFIGDEFLLSVNCVRTFCSFFCCQSCDSRDSEWTGYSGTQKLNG